MPTQQEIIEANRREARKIPQAEQAQLVKKAYTDAMSAGNVGLAASLRRLIPKPEVQVQMVGGPMRTAPFEAKGVPGAEGMEQIRSRNAALKVLPAPRTRAEQVKLSATDPRRYAPLAPAPKWNPQQTAQFVTGLQEAVKRGEGGVAERIKWAVDQGNIDPASLGPDLQSRMATDTLPAGRLDERKQYAEFAANLRTKADLFKRTAHDFATQGAAVDTIRGFGDFSFLQDADPRMLTQLRLLAGSALKNPATAPELLKRISKYVDAMGPTMLFRQQQRQAAQEKVEKTEQAAKQKDEQARALKVAELAETRAKDDLARAEKVRDSAKKDRLGEPLPKDDPAQTGVDEAKGRLDAARQKHDAALRGETAADPNRMSVGRQQQADIAGQTAGQTAPGAPAPAALPPTVRGIWAKVEAGATLKSLSKQIDKLSEEDQRALAKHLRLMGQI